MGRICVGHGKKQHQDKKKHTSEQEKAQIGVLHAGCITNYCVLHVTTTAVGIQLMFFFFVQLCVLVWVDLSCFFFSL